MDEQTKAIIREELAFLALSQTTLQWAFRALVVSYRIVKRVRALPPSD